MSLKLITLSPVMLRAAVIAAVAATTLFAYAFISWSFVNALADNGLDPKVAEARQLASWLPATSPSDPQAHLAAARYFERTFEAQDMLFALREYEAAAAAAPNDFNIWLLLARARSRVGDEAGADQAYQHAFTLAPNYTAVKWAYGNSLLRHGDQNRGFQLIAEAAQAEPQFRGPAVMTALQVLDQDPERVRVILGGTAEIDAAIAGVLAGQKRFKDAGAFWARVPAEKKSAEGFKELGPVLMNLAFAGNEYGVASGIAADLGDDGSERPYIGRITNGGFENGIKLRDAKSFEWQIAEGSEPQIGLNESVKRSGRYSLFLTFNSFEAAGSFRSIAQLAAVEPGAAYEFAGYYRADVKTKAEFRWEIIDAFNQTQLAVTDPLAFAGDWTTIKLRFTAHPSTTGIVVRFVRLNCGSGACPVTGRMAFDDLSLARVSE